MTTLNTRKVARGKGTDPNGDHYMTTILDRATFTQEETQVKVLVKELLCICTLVNS
jgi:hypothetical protein